MVSSMLRSTAAISEYLCLTDSMAVAAETLRGLQRRELELREEVLSQIGDRRSVLYGDEVRTLRRVEQSSYSLACGVTQDAAVQYCLAHGLAVDERTPVHLSGAKISKYGRGGHLPDGIVQVSTKTTIAVD